MLLVAALFAGCEVRRAEPALLITVEAAPDGPGTIRTAEAEFMAHRSGAVRAARRQDGARVSIDAPVDLGPRLTLGGEDLDDVVLDRVESLPGRGLELSGLGTGKLAGLRKSLRVTVSAHLPGLAQLEIRYENHGRAPLAIERLVLARHLLRAAAAERGAAAHALWSFHGSSDDNGELAVLPLAPGFARANRMGTINSRGRGGGIPVVAFWSARTGHALGHLDGEARALALPVQVTPEGIDVRAVYEPAAPLDPGRSLEPPRLFVSVFRGDYYDGLRLYARALQERGFRPTTPSPGAFEPTWCSWGFGRAITPARMLGVLPKLRELGVGWATLDDGWYSHHGDWRPKPGVFDAGGLQRVVRAYHEAGLRVQLWWIPLAAENGSRRRGGRSWALAQVAREHPDWLILGADGRPARIVHGLAALCPALPEVREYHRELVRRFIGEWNLDGHKLDYAFTVPECHNGAHRHASPRDSLHAVDDVYRAIREETRRLKPDAVTQICSCGTLPHHAWLPHLDQAVTADPTGSAQTRRRIVALRALLGPGAAVSGDHVELTRSRRDFASTIALGGVPSTRLVWPAARGLDEELWLTDEKQEHVERWFRLHRELRLWEANYESLYVHGYDVPEAYAFSRGRQRYYAFFRGEGQPPWSGPVELRGLGRGRYRVRDLVADRELASVQGPDARLGVAFDEHLLLEVAPASD